MKYRDFVAALEAVKGWAIAHGATELEHAADEFIDCVIEEFGTVAETGDTDWPPAVE